MKYLKLFEDLVKTDYKQELYDWIERTIEHRFKQASMDDKEELEAKLTTYINTDFPYGLSNIPKKVTLYRVLSFYPFDDIKIDENKIGKHYVGDINIIKDEDFRASIDHKYKLSKEKNEITSFLITIETDSSNIDMKQTLNMKITYPNEYEYTIFDDYVSNDSDVKIISIDKI